MNDDPQLQEAFARLDLLRIADALGIQLKNGVQRSPFRDDKSASFSVFDNAQRFKDWGADISGRQFKFVELARPELTRGQVRNFLVELSGQDPKAGTRITKVERRERLRDRQLSQHRARRAAEAKVEPLPECAPWPDYVRDRYAEGYLRLRKDVMLRSTIGEERGWYDWTVEQLVEKGLIAEPPLPWTSGGHSVAFRVDRPIFGAGAPTLETIGYHQRYIRKRGNAYSQTLSKIWLYVPYIPEDPRTEFMIAMARDRNKVPAFPFVIGNITNPTLIVILEGQWDAVSFWAACGGLGSEAEKNMAVFGLRGASSINIFLSAYARLIRHGRPTVWLIGDNDEAGRRWTSPTTPAGTYPEPSFSDRLQALGAGRLVTTFLKGDGIKDFNDWYARKMPEEQHMAKFFEKARLEWVG